MSACVYVQVVLYKPHFKYKKTQYPHYFTNCEDPYPEKILQGGKIALGILFREEYTKINQGNVNF